MTEDEPGQPKPPDSQPTSGLRFKRHAVRQAGSTTLGQLAVGVIQFTTTIVLARLLEPRAFGLIAMVIVVIGLLALVRDFALTHTVSQAETLTSAQLNGLFWVNILLSVSLALLLSAVSPLVAALYGEPLLVGVTLALSWTLPLTGFGAIHQAILTRELRMTRLVAAEVTAHLTAFIVAVTATSLGAGYWALVLLPLTRAGTLTAGLWVISSWRPARPQIRVLGLTSLLKFGGHITGFNFVNYLARTGDDFAIGLYWGPASLGLYGRAYSILRLPLELLNAPVSRVAIPTLARLHTDSEEYRRAYLGTTRLVATAGSCAMAFTLATSHWLVEVLLGNAWSGAVPMLRWFALAGLLQPLTSTTGWLFISQGRSREMFRLGLFSSALAVLSFLIGLPYGAAWVAGAYALTDLFIRTPLALLWAGADGPVSRRDLVKAAGTPLIAAATVLMAAMSVRLLAPGSPAIMGIGTSFLATVFSLLLLLYVTSEGRAILKDASSVVRSLASCTPYDSGDEL